MEAVEVIKYHNNFIHIYVDESPDNPIREWDTLGTFSIIYKGYNLSSRDGIKDPDELMKFVKRKDVISLPLKVYEHSGLTISASRTGSFGYPYNDRWDSSFVGFVHISFEKLKKNLM